MIKWVFEKKLQFDDECGSFEKIGKLTTNGSLRKKYNLMMNAGLLRKLGS